MKKKILILTTNYLPNLGGSELAIKNITDRIGDFEFDLITGKFSREVPAEEKIGNVNVYRVGEGLTGADLFLPKLFLPFAIFFKAVSLLRKNQYAAMHAFQASQAAGGGLLASLFFPRVPFILSFQEGKELDRQSELVSLSRKLIFNSLDRATAISGYLGQYIKSVRSDISVDIIPNGVDIKSYSENYSSEELSALSGKIGIKKDEKVIVTVSRLVHKNGVDTLIKAAAELLKKHPGFNFRVLIIGDGEDREKLLKLADESGVGSRMVFAGNIDNAKIPAYLKISDVFVRLSRSEGLGNSFLEAMAAGIPVVGTPVGGIPDFLTDNETGLMANSEDPADAADKIYRLLTDEQLREKVILKARNIVEDKYDWGKIAEQFDKLYKSIAE